MFLAAMCVLAAVGSVASPSSSFPHFSLSIAMAARIPPTSLLKRLADVELQLVMHGLDAPSLLQFARCSHQLLHAADHPFAWSCSSSPALHLPPSKLEVAVAHPACLLRHSRVALCWSATDPAASVRSESAHQLIGAVSSLALPLHELAYLDSSRDFRVSKSDWMRVLTSPAVHPLRILRMIGCSAGVSLDASIVRAIAQLPHLHTLAVDQCALKADMWAALPDAPALTSLAIVDHHQRTLEDGFANSCLRFVAQCSKLIHLDIQSFALQGAGFQALFALSPHIRRLQSLTLRRLDCRSVPPAAYAAVFSSLAELHSVRLLDCRGIHSLLPSLACAGALRHLDVEVPDDRLGPDDTPSAAILSALFLAAPMLHCTLTSTDQWVQLQFREMQQQLQMDDPMRSGGSQLHVRMH